VFLLVPAYQGSPGQRAIKRLLLLLYHDCYYYYHDYYNQLLFLFQCLSFLDLIQAVLVLVQQMTDAIPVIQPWQVK